MFRALLMAIAIVQHSSIPSNASSVTVALTVTPTAKGNLLVACCGNNGGRVTLGVTDGASDFKPVAGSVSSNVDGRATDVWFLPLSSAGPTTITATFSGAPGTFEKSIFFFEVSGFSSPGVDVAGVVNNGAGSGTDVNGAPVLTTSDQGFIAAIAIVASAIVDNPKTGNEFSSGGDLSTFSDAACSLISATAAAHQPVWTDSVSGVSFASSTAAFKECPPAATSGGMSPGQRVG